jgi:hypothetical protein
MEIKQENFITNLMDATKTHEAWGRKAEGENCRIRRRRRRVTLHISKSLALPIDAVTQKFGILGRTGSGKSYFATKLCEEMLDAKAQIVALDPVGVWWGLRTPGENGPQGFTGYKIPIFGGLHGDIPLEPGAGALIADLIVDKTISAVVDVSNFLMSEQRKFATDFAVQLFHRKKSQRSALHLFIEESQEFVPQQVRGDVAKMVGAYERLLKLGRNFGIGASLISQRPQSVNKDVLNQTECLFAFQMTGPQERKAIESWVSEKGLEKDIIGELPKLKTGEAHVWSPQWLQISETVKIAEKKTADVSATPKPGVKPIEPKQLSQIELEDLSDKMLATIERAKQEDPKQLRKEIVQLKQELSKRGVEKPTRVEVKEKLVLKDDQLNRIEKLAERLTEMSQLMATSIRQVTTARREPQPVRTVVQALVPRTSTHVQRDNGDQPLGKCERAILSALAQYPQGRSSTQVAIITGYSGSSGGFNNSLSRLRSSGYITRGNPILITDDGLKVLGDWEPLPTGQGLLQHWLGRLGKCERSILETLAANYPNGLNTQELGDATGYAASSGGFNNSLSRLRTLELINRGQPIQISEEFYQ